MNRRKIFCTLCGIGLTATASLSGESSYTDAQSFEPGHELCNKPFPAVYNRAARPDACNSWDCFATASFTYWHADQDGMDLAAPLSIGALSDHEIVFPNCTYSPGFKLGLGMNFGHDRWIGFMEYTWFRQKIVLKESLENLLDVSTFWGRTPFAGSFITDYIDARTHLHLDVVDATLSRPYYLGKSLTVYPFGGLRGAWIRQQCILEGIEPTTKEIYLSTNLSHSLAVGPRVGAQAHLLLSCGFRLEGDMAASILYTNYLVRHDGPYLIGERNDHTLRPEADLGLGLGWGTYLYRQNYHLDILATYDFSIFWKQNMMRPLANYSRSLDIAVPGDLNLHGLTITARFDF